MKDNLMKNIFITLLSFLSTTVWAVNVDAFCNGEVAKNILQDRVLAKYEKNVFLKCDDPRLLQEVAFGIDLQLFSSAANSELAAAGLISGVRIPKGVESPVIPVTWARTRLDAPRLIKTQKVDVRGKKIDVISCSADISIELVDKRIFKCADQIGNQIDRLIGDEHLQAPSASEEPPKRPNYVPNPALEAFIEDPKYISKFTGTVDFNAQIADESNKKWVDAGGRFNFNTTSSRLMGGKVLSKAHNEIERIYSFFDTSKPLMKSQNKLSWSPTFANYFNDKCKSYGFRNKTCDCVQSKTIGFFSEMDMLRLQYSSYHSDPNPTTPAERSKFYFPFSANGYFVERLYPDTKKIYNEIVEKCDAR
jgi:hypothetical protein